MNIQDLQQVNKLIDEHKTLERHIVFLKERLAVFMDKELVIKMYFETEDPAKDPPIVDIPDYYRGGMGGTPSVKPVQQEPRIKIELTDVECIQILGNLISTKKFRQKEIIVSLKEMEIEL